MANVSNLYLDSFFLIGFDLTIIDVISSIEVKLNMWAVAESLSESEQEQWSEEIGKSKDWVVWCRSRKKDEEQRPFEVDGKEIFSNRSQQANPKKGEKTDKKGGKGQSVRWKAWWRQGNIKCAVSEEYASC